MWREKINQLNDDNKWDEEFKNIMLEAEYNICIFDQIVRDEFKVKKDLRNACAHNKSRGITDATVEDLWDYIKWVKPLAVINGIDQLIIDKINEIIKFRSTSEYETNAIALYNNYAELRDEKRRVVFDKFCKMINEHLEDEALFCSLFEQIFQKRDCSEAIWIVNNIEAELFVKLNVDNYNYEIDKVKIYDKICKEDIDSTRFPPNGIFNVFRKCTNTQKKKIFLKEIYNNENNYNHWLNLVISSKDWKLYLQDKDILSNVIQENNLNQLFEDIKELYKYKSGYGGGKTDTFDYSVFGYDKITNKVFLALWLIKENKIKSNDDANDLVKRCVRIVDMAQKYNNDNMICLNSELKLDEDIYKWICSLE